MHRENLLILIFAYGALAALNGYSPNQDADQYHIQTDGDDERYFVYQTNNGQYRKERRLKDGSVVGTTGWVGADGYLRLQDYIADDQGYRIHKSKTVYVGENRPIGESMKIAKTAPTDSGFGITRAPIRTRVRTGSTASITPSSTTPRTFPHEVSITPSPYTPTRQDPLDYSKPTPITAADALSSNSIDYEADEARKRLDIYNPNSYRHSDAWLRRNKGIGDGYTPQFPKYDGTAIRKNGFMYYLPKQYHEEFGTGSGDQNGSFGYVDPFGIRRVIYYNASPEGFKIRKNNRYVGHDATPYDPRPIA